MLRNVEIQTIFWGPNWSNGTEVPSRTQLAGAILDIVNGPYLQKMNQYQGADGLRPFTARMLPKEVVVSTAPGSNCDVGGLINGLFANGTLPPPFPGNDNLYSIFIQNASTQCTAPPSHHPGQFNGVDYYFSMIRVGDAKSLREVVGVFTHELVEGISDPKTPPGDSQPGDSGTYVVAPQGCNCELADVCPDAVPAYPSNSTHDLATYWSQVDHACVAPRAWNNVSKFISTNNWQSIATDVVHAAAGPLGIAIKSTDQKIRLISPTGSTVVIGDPLTAGSVPPVAELAIDGSTVYAIPLDTAAGVFKWNGFGLGWTAIQGSGEFPAFEASSLVAGSTALMTDPFSGGIYRLTNGTWSIVSSAATNHLAANGSEACFILDNATRTIKCLFGFTLTTLPGSGRNLFMGPLGLALLGMDYNVYASVGSSWVFQGGAGYDFALDNAHMFGTSPDLAAVWMDGNFGANGPAWSPVAPPSARLFGGGNNMYAASVGMTM